ncbi:DUF2922 domain-containing protein [Heyndrickxia sporothermodurans]|uniref:Uncharacterized protein n=1 Tax=Heyndrickxia sporothermodurans TaxID=46224 RepID=A0A150LFX1_9BACI|nr:DUF2922 domain-containing protein [Heyndrickxia sporothermodurans]KYD10652.1 hypothetical protein B4102_2291 [Heyndrickxia sporothermodurans]MEB6549175.1 DUF2922 domain-containing protein [Heyndrickxia sporothermodurans]MED3650449.1 DUF2922 domain-containing protein [Heyndrickxia sporothermodurans]MED3699274.1 DUF2922 domain-containing protein [Heyndrickxia sporothermodurans]MED3780155.1 DUF2922 domain-containing protein [Heyndrickxia sporothermodurans]
MKTLELQFTTSENKTARISIEDPIEPVDTNKVKAAMEEIIASNVFVSSTGSAYTEIKGVRLIENNVTEYTV